MEPDQKQYVNDCNLAWAAGLFEGEGYFRSHRVGSRIYLGIGIEMRDADVVERFVTILRDNGITRADRPSGPRRDSQIRVRSRSQKNPKHSDIYVWTTSGPPAIEAYLLLRPHLGDRRKARGDSILAAQEKLLQEIPTHGICAECGKTFPFQDYGRTRSYCTERCRGRAERKRPGYREAQAERMKRYYSNPAAQEKRRARDRRWYANNPEKAAEKNRKGRERRRAQRQKLGAPLRTC